MKFVQLLRKSNQHLRKHPPASAQKISGDFFTSGAAWMHEQLHPLENDRSRAFNRSVNYAFYGFMKYAVSLLAFGVSFFILLRVNVWLTPLAVPVFYFFEIHFLFLFPLLIDGSPQPIRSSIKATYRTGVFSALFNVMPIGIYMMFGLLNFRDPLRNWYAGCYSILTWYNDEIRART
ncbi:MAG: hypothetical protein FD123_3435 [Bacteroidetes bacterium]|nr:MAG: hypothetical protein FD123_3435 [Bacteroidota bacterium]